MRPRALLAAITAAVGLTTTIGLPGAAPARPVKAEADAVAKAKAAPELAAGRSGEHWMLLGRSEQGRAILAVRVGNPAGPRVLVVGCIHGNETAGIPIARALEHGRTRDDVWIVPDLNPDGVAHGTRQDAHGVDLNANWSSGWQRGGVPFDPYYGGPHPFSERETQIARRLILRIHPRLTVWYHQHMDVVWAYGPSTTAGRLYAQATGMRLYHHLWLPGTSTNWQNHQLSGTAAVTVELPAGVLSRSAVLRHMRAVLSVTRALP